MSHDEQTLPPGHRLEEYVIDKVLGSGGFGITYLARDAHLDRSVAIKEYYPFHLARRGRDQHVSPHTGAAEKLSEYNWGLDRFVDEARALARFEHPNVVRVVRYMQRQGTAYIVMEFVPGQPLSALAGPRIPPEADLRALLLALLDGLATVHATGLLHRDIKPANIIVRPDATPVFIDFGAARQAIGSRSQPLSTILTPGYAPMEQYYSRGNQGPWTDIYAMAAVMHTCLMGEPPAEAPERPGLNGTDRLALRARGRASDDFLKALDWALSPNERDRPQNVADWRKVLVGGERTRTDTPPALPPSPPSPRPPPERVAVEGGLGRLPLLVAGGGVAVGAALIAYLTLGPDGGRQQLVTPTPALSSGTNQANAKLGQPQDAVAMALDDESYSKAVRIGTPEAYAVYLRLHPDGRHAAQARGSARTP